MTGLRPARRPRKLQGWDFEDPTLHPDNEWGNAIGRRPGLIRYFCRFQGVEFDSTGTPRKAEAFLLDHCRILGWRRWTPGQAAYGGGYRAMLTDTRRAGIHVVVGLREGPGDYRFLAAFRPGREGVLVIDPANPAMPVEPLADAVAHEPERRLLDEILRTFYRCRWNDPVGVLPSLCLFSREADDAMRRAEGLPPLDPVDGASPLSTPTAPPR